MVYVHKAGPIWLIGWGTGTMDAETRLRPTVQGAGDLRQLVQRGLQPDVRRGAEPSWTRRSASSQYHRINKLWIDEVPAVPLYQQVDLYGASKRLNWKARSDELIPGLRHVAQGREVGAARIVEQDRSRRAAVIQWQNASFPSWTSPVRIRSAAPTHGVTGRPVTPSSLPLAAVGTIRAAERSAHYCGGDGAFRARSATTPASFSRATGFSMWYWNPARKILARCSGPVNPVRAAAGVAPPRSGGQGANSPDRASSRPCRA